MKKLVEVPNVTDWEEKFWFSTGGTRAKKIIENPAGGLYYFKLSAEKPATSNKPGKYFKFEFWSEIIAYKVGKLLGFDVLEYLPAIDGERVGCLCADMINSGKEEFIGGIQYLQGALPSFNPELNEERSQYTFQLIEEALLKYSLERFFAQIVEMIVFDSLIGNSDRHQENWAVISGIDRHTKEAILIKKEADQLANDVREMQSGMVKIASVLKEQYQVKIINDLIREVLIIQDKIGLNSRQAEELRLQAGENKFSPLFDNGSSLGRELEESRVENLLDNPTQLKKYISRGTSAIHWEGRKVSHFELLRQLLGTEHGSQIRAVFERVQNLFDVEKLEKMVQSIDENIPKSHAAFMIPIARKQLIVRMITLRFQTLHQLCNEGI